MTEQGTRSSDEGRFVSFKLEDRRFAVDIRSVREVHRPLNLTPARGADTFVRGMINLRGQIITVLDPAQRLGFAPREQTELTRLVIFKTNAELRARGLDEVATCDDQVAWWVDEISDVVVCDRSEVEPPTASSLEGAGSDLLSGLIQRSDDVVRVIDPAATVAIADLALDA